MNRRSFLKNSGVVLFGFTVLPSAETYQRIWKVQSWYPIIPILPILPMIPVRPFNPLDYIGEFSVINIPDGHILSQNVMDPYFKSLTSQGFDGISFLRLTE